MKNVEISVHRLLEINISKVEFKNEFNFPERIIMVFLQERTKTLKFILSKLKILTPIVFVKIHIKILKAFCKQIPLLCITTLLCILLYYVTL